MRGATGLRDRRGRARIRRLPHVHVGRTRAPGCRRPAFGVPRCDLLLVVRRLRGDVAPPDRGQGIPDAAPTLAPVFVPPAPFTVTGSSSPARSEIPRTGRAFRTLSRRAD